MPIYTPANSVPVAPIREAVLLYLLRTGVTMNELARWCGYVRSNEGRPGKGDGKILARRLGIAPHNTATKRRGSPHFQTRLGYESAARIIRAIGEDPVDFGV